MFFSIYFQPGIFYTFNFFLYTFRASRGKQLSLVIRFLIQGRQPDELEIWTHSSDTIASIKRQVSICNFLGEIFYIIRIFCLPILFIYLFFSLYYFLIFCSFPPHFVVVVLTFRPFWFISFLFSNVSPVVNFIVHIPPNYFPP